MKAVSGISHFQLIQPVLIMVIVAIYLFYIFRLKNPLPIRISVLIFLGTGIVFIISPNTCHKVAAIFGVGRGADFVFYLLFCFLLFVSIVLYTRILDLEAKVTLLSREIALNHGREAKRPISGGDHSP